MNKEAVLERGRKSESKRQATPLSASTPDRAIPVTIIGRTPPAETRPTTIVDLLDPQNGGSTRRIDIQDLSLLVSSLKTENTAKRATDGQKSVCQSCATFCGEDSCVGDPGCV